MRISDWSSDVCSSDLTQIWPLASGLAGFSVGSSEIATVRRGWPSFVNPWIFLPLLSVLGLPMGRYPAAARLSTTLPQLDSALPRSEEHTSELQSLMRISYAVFCLKKKNNKYTATQTLTEHTKMKIQSNIRQHQ